MCGIFGVMSFREPIKNIENNIQIAAHRLKHRGPDGDGIWISKSRSVGFAHKRLSILELGETGAQPMVSNHESSVIVFNGEIYNHLDIRKELIAKGYQFRSAHSDTETILYAYEEWGEKCLDRMNGMFAFCIYDNKKDELFLARDRMGEKPLYYYLDHNIFAFSSEIKAFKGFPGIDFIFDESKMYNFFAFRIAGLKHTFFKNIYKVRSGHFIKVKRNGTASETPYWDPFENQQVIKNEDEALEKFEYILRDSVKIRLQSDVPLGLFLSGGIDSSINLIFSQNNNIEKCFHINYENYPNYSELKDAENIAAFAGRPCLTKSLTYKDFQDKLPGLFNIFDEPIASLVCISRFFLSQFSRENNIKVCHAGIGGDEIFGGYPYYESLWRLEKYSNMLPLIPGWTIKKSLLKIMSGVWDDKYKKYEYFKRALLEQPIFWGSPENFTPNHIKAVLGEKVKASFTGNETYRDIIEPFWIEFNEKSKIKDLQTWMTYIDIKLRFPEITLPRIDMASMANSVEVRSPFLDHRLAELSLSIPQKILVKGFEKKYLLKKIAGKYLPERQVNKKKEGFGLPGEGWFKGVNSGEANGKIVKFAKETGLLNANYLPKFFKNHRGLYFQLFNFVSWHENHF